MFEAIGAHLAEQGVERVAAIATNYQAGWDAVEGLKRGYGGDLAAEVLVKLDQSDFGAELSQIRSAAPQALVMFLPGGSGIAFMRQFAGAGLNETIEPYAATFQADETIFAALGETAEGLVNAGPWNPYLENEANKRFVEAFRDEYGRNPSIFAAMAYDTVLMLDAAVAAADGEIDDAERFREALRDVELRIGPRRFRVQQQPLPGSGLLHQPRRDRPGRRPAQRARDQGFRGSVGRASRELPAAVTCECEGRKRHERNRTL